VNPERLLTVSLVLGIFLSGTSVCSVWAGQATVLSIGDGDTITVTEGATKTKVRLACIDAPEMAQSPYGGEARKEVQALVPVGTPVTLRKVANDRYGRTVAEVLRGSTNVNLVLVQRGFAFAYRDYLQNCDRNAYLGAERQAEAAHKGVWSVTGGITRPWDWRHGTRPNRAKGGVTPSASTSRTTSGGRYTCGKIGNFARAQELLKQGNTYLDGDKDGVACESLR
jgi:micrococcal nuclease